MDPSRNTDGRYRRSCTGDVAYGAARHKVSGAGSFLVGTDLTAQGRAREGGEGRGKKRRREEKGRRREEP
jgi:hypothetical protein